jgi:hypothetical protein
MTMSKKLILTGITACLLPTAGMAEMSVSLADKSWNGKAIPEAQQCQRFGGVGKTPRLRVSNLPKETNALVVSYSDRTYKQMDNGGHGKLGFRIDDTTGSVLLPEVPGHQFQLPDGVFSVAPHRAPQWDTAGAYLPPCSGGKGNQYYATVEAVKLSETSLQLLESSTIELGAY